MECTQLNNLQSNKLEYIFQLLRGKDLFVAEQMCRIHGVQKGGEPAARQAIGKLADSVVETVAARGVDQQEPART